MEQIVVVTYRGDLPQFKLMLHCLNKFWQGNKQITVAVTCYNNEPAEIILPDVREILKTQLSDDWAVHLFPVVKTKIGGYNEAQLYKFLIAKSDLADDSVVLDCKDFLLKPASFNDFVSNKKYKIIHFNDSTKTYQDYYPKLTTELGITQDIPKNIILTPYTFNKKQMQRVWDKFIGLFGDYSNWTTFPTMIECGSYYTLTYTDPDPFIKYVEQESPDFYWMPFGGVWIGQQPEEILEQFQTFDLYEDRKFWKHHRAVSGATEVTAEILEKHGIDPKVVQTWITEKNNTKI